MANNDKARINEINGMIAGLQRHVVDMQMLNEAAYADRKRAELLKTLEQATAALKSFDDTMAALPEKITQTESRIDELKGQVSLIRNAKQIEELRKLALQMQGVTDEDMAAALAAEAPESSGAAT